MVSDLWGNENPLCHSECRGASFGIDHLSWAALIFSAALPFYVETLTKGHFFLFKASRLNKSLNEGGEDEEVVVFLRNFT